MYCLYCLCVYHTLALCAPCAYFTLNCEIIFICWTYNFMYFMGMAIHTFKIPTKKLFTFIILGNFFNRQIHMTINNSIIV